ncbi:MAG: pitrilysin family protein [Thermodesulfobacteriota bacterium]
MVHNQLVTYLFGFIALVAIALVRPMDAYAIDGNITNFTLPNGLEVLVKEDHARKVTALQIWVKVGSADEEQDERGISHLIEHMAFKGTERRGVGTIASEVESLGGDINAYTSWDETVFHIVVPSSATVQGLDILTDAVLRPVIDPGELEKEKQVVIEEILEGEERPERKAGKFLLLNAYTASPYRYPIIGYKETVERFTRDNIERFRQKWYVPENMLLVIVGDVDPTALKPELARMTADFKPQGFFRHPRAQEPPQEKTRTAVMRDNNSRETRLHMAFHIPSIHGVDVNALDLTSDLLGARESSRLVRAIKKEKGLVNTISASAMTPKETGVFIISATLESKNIEAVTRAIMDEVAKLAKTPPSEEELDRAKTNIEAQHILARETVQGMARNLGSFRTDLGDAHYEKKYLELNRIVKPKQASEVTARYLVPPNVTLTLLIPEKDRPDFKVDSLQDVLKTYEPPEPPSRVAARAPEVLTATLDNGMRVVLVPDRSNSVVSFRVGCLGGKRYENEQDQGIMNFISRMLDKGTQTLNEGEISRKIEDMGGRLKGFAGYDSFGLAGHFFSRHLDDGLKLVMDLYAHPSFPQDRLDRERSLILNQIKTEPDRPVEFAVQVFSETLFPKHPYGYDKHGSVETVTGFTREDLLEAYKRFSVPANTVMTVVGDLDPQVTLAKIKELFGGIPATRFEAPEVTKEAPLTETRRKTLEIPRAKAHLLIGFRGTTFTDKERYSLTALNNILAGQGGRLFLELRDKESLAYVVTSIFRPGIDPGFFAIYMACDVAKLDQAEAGLLREINRVRTEPVSAAELHRSITNLVGNYQIHLQSTSARAENTCLNTLYGLGYDFDKEYVEKIKAVTSADVLDAAKQFLSPDKCAIVKILPGKEG